MCKKYIMPKQTYPDFLQISRVYIVELLKYDLHKTVAPPLRISHFLCKFFLISLECFALEVLPVSLSNLIRINTNDLYYRDVRSYPRNITVKLICHFI